MECSLQDKIRNGIYNSVKSEVLQTDLFTFIENKNLFIPKYPDVSEKVLEINNSYKAKVLTQSSEGGYNLIIPKSLVDTYSKLSSPETSKVINLMKKHMIYRDNIVPNNINYNTFFSAIHSPEISEFTYEKLVSFLKSINPDLKIELLSELSEDGISFIKDFIIGIRTDQRLKAMPEEVSHFFVELLPDESDLKKELLSNVTSFEIYSQVFKQYEKVYVKENGKPDTDKIKREAAAKLIGEYIYAISENDYTRVNKLTRVKEGWIKKWLRKLLEFFNIKIITNPDYKYYYQSANEILTGNASEQFKKDAQARLENEAVTDTYFFRLTEEQFGKRYATRVTELRPLAQNLYDVSKDKNLPEIIDTVRLFKRKFNETFKSIMEDERFATLKEQLTVSIKNFDLTTDQEFLDVNALLLLNDKLKATSGISLSQVAEAENIVNGFYQFLETVDKLSVLSDALYDVVNNKEKTEDFYKAVDNINELQLYTRLYTYMKNILDNELSEELQKTGMGREILDVIKNSTSKFEMVTQRILSKQREYFLPLYSELLSFTRGDNVAIKLQEDMKRYQLEKNEFGMQETAKKIKKFVETNEKIDEFLMGLGKDTDLLQQVGFWANAAISNGDVYISSIVNYIQDKVYENEMKSNRDISELYQQIDELKKQGLSGEAHVLGKLVTRVSKKYDAYSKDGSPMEVLSFLSPVKYNEFYIEQKRLQDSVSEKAKEFYNAKGTDQEETKRLAWMQEKLKLDEFLFKYKFNKYNKEFYSVYQKYSKNPLFIEQLNEWQIYSTQIQQERNTLLGAYNIKEIETKIAILRRMQATLLTDFDESGNERTPDGKVAASLLKQYFEESSRFREDDVEASRLNFAIAKSSYMSKVMEVLNRHSQYKITVGQFEERIKQDLGMKVFYVNDEFGNRKDLDLIITDEDIETVASELEVRWISNNERISIKQSYWDKRNAIKEEIDRLQKGQPESPALEKWKKISEILSGSRDAINQVNPDALEDNEIEKIIELEIEIDTLKSSKVTSALDYYSEEDQDKLIELTDQLDDPNITQTQADRIQRQIDKIIKSYRKDPIVSRLNEYFKLLGQMKTFVPTEYYWEKLEDLYVTISEYSKRINDDAAYLTDSNLKDYAATVNSFVDFFGNVVFNRDFKEMYAIFSLDDSQGVVFNAIMKGEKSLGIASIGDLLADEKSHSDIIEWFDKVHLVDKKVRNPNTKRSEVLKYFPSTIYQQLVPTNKNDYDIILSKKYTVRKVKDEFYTGYNPQTKKVELKVGYHVDNRGRLLPLPKEENPYDNTFVDEEYYKLKSSNPLAFKYMEILKNLYLKDQERVDEELRRYLDVPVLSLTSIEEKMRIGKTAKETWNEVTSFFGSQKETAELTEQESGYRDIKDYNGITGEIVTGDMPRLGMGQRIPVDWVSTNLVNSISQYNYKSHDFAARSERLPVMQALVNTVSTNQKGAGNRNRATYFRKVYEKSILGAVPDNLVNNKFIAKATRALTAGSSWRLMLNPVGGAINYMGASINNFVEAFSGKYVNIKEYTLGSIDAGKMMLAITGDYAKSTDLSYWTLLYQAFDFVQGDFLDDLLDRSSLLNKVSQFRQLAMLPMKAGELKAQSSMALGILYRRKAKDKNGKEYPFHQIYEKKGNKLVLKEGFDEEKYNPLNGTEFLKAKKIIHKINLELHGNYAKINSTELSRYSFGKLAENLKKWFVPALQRRFGREGLDVVTEEMDGGGYYRALGVAMWEIAKSLAKGDMTKVREKFLYYIKDEAIKKNLARMSFDALMAVMLYMIYGLMLGYSGDDKNKKLKENSLIHNLAILVFMRVYSEHTSYIPAPYFGLQELKRNLLSPFSLQADTISNWLGAGTLAIGHLAYTMGATGLEKDLFYQKDAGYWYAEKGDAKVWKYVLRSFGYTGFTFEPIQYIKDFSNLQGRLK
jgi:hypothetical protein